MPIILATCKAEIRQTAVRASPGKKCVRPPHLQNNQTKMAVFFSFLLALGFELRASHLLGRQSYPVSHSAIPHTKMDWRYGSSSKEPVCKCEALSSNPSPTK
jgi:hypothetical protein